MAMTEFELVSVIIRVLIGAGQIGVVLYGIARMTQANERRAREAAEDRQERAEAAQRQEQESERRAQAREQESERRAQARERESERRHAEAMAALKALIAGQDTQRRALEGLIAGMETVIARTAPGKAS